MAPVVEILSLLKTWTRLSYIVSNIAADIFFLFFARSQGISRCSIDLILIAYPSFSMRKVDVFPKWSFNTYEIISEIKICYHWYFCIRNLSQPMSYCIYDIFLWIKFLNFFIGLGAMCLSVLISAMAWKLCIIKSKQLGELTHLSLVPHICFSESGQHWFI